MKRYIIEERESTDKTCEGCMFDNEVDCSATLFDCSPYLREDKKRIIFVLVKEEEIK